MRQSLNVLGRKLEVCSASPLTGFYRDECCNTGREDHGAHIVCTQVTAEFLEFSKTTGNDLSTPHPEWLFPGLKPGDRWCVCASRWIEAYEAGVIGPVYLEGTHIALLEFISLDELRKVAVSD